MSTHQMIHKRLRVGPATMGEIADDLGKSHPYMAGRMTTMFQLGLVVRTTDRPAKYSQAYDILPADIEAIATMIKVYGAEALIMTVAQAAKLYAEMKPSEETGQ